ncbi:MULTISPECIES: GNAT family N-acetyltransferase [Sphingobacterium]|uniref:GNAT family N-acetyltransferase n=1 Tax=Sphingobacterium TaxID=28453 RepID=UPI0013DBAD76|nr:MULTISPECIES: GNAT family N-acetyltransferase [unclassified Sphingobacterium]
MHIRKAKKEDAPQIAELMILAMTEIVYQFIGQEDLEEGKRFLCDLIQKQNNQYSYQYIFVAENDDEIMGQICLYPGGQLRTLRQPVLDRIKENYHIDYQPADETQEGEIYIDTIAVSPQAQGKGIGRFLIEFVIKEFVNKRKDTLGLLVDCDNPNAKRLYEKMGFVVKNNLSVFGKKMDHMQYEP